MRDESNMRRPHPSDTPRPMTEARLVAWYLRLKNEETEARMRGDHARADVLLERSELAWDEVQVQRRRNAVEASARLERDGVGEGAPWWGE